MLIAWHVHCSIPEINKMVMKIIEGYKEKGNAAE